jgi:outer membrane protein assembly factor BamA
MGTFKFVKNRFDPINDSQLNVYYYLTPYPRKSIRFEIGGLTQNDNRAGTRGSISWRNRNTSKGAEELTFKINGGFEAQYNGVSRRPNIYNFGSELNLSFPRFVVPFIEINTTSQYLPRTLASLKYRYESQSNLLRINSYTASYGFAWKEGQRKEHQLFPFNITYVKTDTLGNADQLRLLYSSLIFNGIIIGPTYEFSYNSRVGMSRPNDFFFNGLIDLSGNILGIAQKADYESNPRTLFGSRYAQYVKLQPDFRFFHRFSSTTNFASRLLMGIGIPYGNSARLPNVKQFWAGGNSDLRGFPSRLVGPGTFNERFLYKTNNYIEALGDLKLEANAEIRQQIYKFLHGAVFADAGNIWLYRDNAAFPGGTFSSKFYRELCADVGVGLRFDFKILILRFDMGMPVRKPWLPEGDRWVFHKIALADPAWKKENLFLNIAIGYPF